MARLTDVKGDRPVARAVPGRQAAVRQGPSLVERITRYFREVYAELKRVDWPSRQELTAMTIVVIVVLGLMSIYLGLWDLLFAWVFQRAIGP